jgi:membrane fusion protein, copper/silver efflux system
VSQSHLEEARPETRHRFRQTFFAGAGVLAARLRFVALLAGALTVAAAWPTLRNVWDKLTRPPIPNAAISPDTEYWCPMCPGVVADWPGKCPVCNMALVRRLKGEMTPLPDGVLARMQFSPYRVQLAGIRTSNVEYRALTRTLTLAGLLEQPDSKSTDGKAVLSADVAETDIELVPIGRTVEVTADAFPGRAFTARITRLASQLTSGSRMARVRLEIENTDHGLLPGMYASATVRVPLASVASQERFADAAWRDRTAATIAAASLFSQPHEAALAPMLEAAVAKAAQSRGFVLAVPESAVIDTGTRKAVYLQGSPGSFDCVELTLGRRCDGWYQVLTGVDSGQAVVTAGAFLIDAETRLNPATAAAYFGAAGRANGIAPPPAASTPALPTRPVKSSDLSPEDQRLVAEQKICPVTGAALGSMGTPKRVMIDGRVVFVCCDGCTSTLKKDPAKYLAKLSGK